MAEAERFHYERLISEFSETVAVSCQLVESPESSQPNSTESLQPFTVETDTGGTGKLSTPSRCNLTRLLIFDFDSTLFRSPLPNRKLWHTELLGALLADCGWFADGRTLSAPYIPEKPSITWWDEETVRAARESISRKDDTVSVLMTGRRHNVFSERIREIAHSLEPPLHFDLFFFREGHDPTQPRHYPTTLDFKVAVLRNLLQSIPSIKHVEFFDDRSRHLNFFTSELTALQKKQRIETFNCHFIQHDPALEQQMPEELEKSLVVDLVSRSNERIAKCRRDLEEAAAAQECEEIGGDGEEGCVKNLRKTNKLTLPRRTSASFFREPIDLAERVKYTAVCLDAQSSERLLSLTPRPAKWTVSADHITICLGPAQEKYVEPMGGLGATVHAFATAIGQIPNRITAIKVESDPCHLPLLSFNDTPHVTLFFAPDAKAKESNDITEWTPLAEPIPITGTLREVSAVGIKGAEKKVQAPKQAISIGNLVQKHHPGLKGKEIGEACKRVQVWMEKMVIENADTNRAMIEWYIQGLAIAGEGGEKEEGGVNGRRESAGGIVNGSTVTLNGSGGEEKAKAVAKGVIQLGLENISRLLDGLDNPHRGLKVVHVAGTNGKGSICAAVSAVLTKAGYRTGRFNSPHLLHTSDAIHINDEPISQSEYDATLSRVLTRAQELELEITTFEAQTCVAFLTFKQHHIDIAILECGLGGRLDATNVCDAEGVEVCVFASVGLDHVEFLGGTVGEIAGEKAGIVKSPHSAVVVGVQREEGVLGVLESKARGVGCRDFEVVEDVGEEEEGWMRCEFGGEEIRVRVNLNGKFQRGNMATAVRVLDVLRRRGWDRVSREAVVDGLEGVRWPGRLEWVDVGGVGKVLVDGAHNLQAAEALAEFVDLRREEVGGRSVTWVIGMTAGKDASGLFRALLSKGDRLFLSPFSQPEQMPWIRPAATEALRERAREVLPDVECVEVADVEEAMIALGHERLSLIVVCGSLYLVADFFRYVNRKSSIAS
ncbi:folylpolyglutamate synthase [Rhizophlyctis rosea]|nr:folylpolyglutamate synthase [Rhizophlyctis rosea]